MIEKISGLRMISAIKIGDFDVNIWVSFNVYNLYKVLFFLKLAWNYGFEPKNNFDFGLIVGFGDKFWVDKGYKHVLQSVNGVL
jgi:hypothetical protein